MTRSQITAGPALGSRWTFKNENGSATWTLEAVEPHVDPCYRYRLRRDDSTATGQCAHDVVKHPNHMMHVEALWFSLNPHVKEVR